MGKMLLSPKFTGMRACVGKAGEPGTARGVGPCCPSAAPRVSAGFGRDTSWVLGSSEKHLEVRPVLPGRRIRAYILLIDEEHTRERL